MAAKQTPQPKPGNEFDSARILSPRRSTTTATSIEELAEEQLRHFQIDPDSEYGQAMFHTVLKLYQAQVSIQDLWSITLNTLKNLDRQDRIAYFNAKKFLCFQLAKLLDTLQNPFRATYQSLEMTDGTMCSKGPYSIFDNVTALFSANPVIVRSATYIYACTEWIDDAFKGNEVLHEMYSRLLNPTSISLANYIVDLEAGPYARQYWAYNFNSGMAAIDTILTHLINYEDIIICSRDIYGSTYQLVADLFGRKNKQRVTLEWFEGYTGEEFDKFLQDVQYKHRLSIERGRKIHVYLESPCNPHGYVLDVPQICSVAHESGCTVVLDSTVGTSFLHKPLQRDNAAERPDFLVHSYTKDIGGHGVATAGVIIGRNENMFLPKDQPGNSGNWEKTLFWNVYFIKGAFLDSDKAFDVLNGIKTLDLRMKQKCINTRILAGVLDFHPDIRVNCNALEHNRNYKIAQQVTRYGMAAPLFTIDLEAGGISTEIFHRFCDCLSPMFNHMVSLGQTNTMMLCPGLTSHSMMTEETRQKVSIFPTTLRIAVGLENPKQLIAHFVNAAKLTINPEYPGFSDKFMSPDDIDRIAEEIYIDSHRRYVQSGKSMKEFL